MWGDCRYLMDSKDELSAHFDVHLNQYASSRQEFCKYFLTFHFAFSLFQLLYIFSQVFPYFRIFFLNNCHPRMPVDLSLLSCRLYIIVLF